jgi:hypothetical protein
MAGNMTQSTRATAAPPPGEISGGDEPMERTPARQSARQPERFYVPPEPHEKYHIDPRDIPAGFDAQWVAVTIKGAKNGALTDYWRGGWRPARAEQFPDQSGYGIEFPKELIDAGYAEQVKPESPVEKDGQMLMMRPKQASIAADERRKRNAAELVQTQMQRLSLSSRRHIRERTEVSVGRQYLNVDSELQGGEV